MPPEFGLIRIQNQVQKQEENFFFFKSTIQLDLALSAILWLQKTGKSQLSYSI